MKIALTPVKSSQIASIGYDAASKTLAVQFKRFKDGQPTTVYHYSNVEPETFAQFEAAESKGRFFGAQIKGNTNYPYQKIEPEDKDEAQGEAA